MQGINKVEYYFLRISAERFASDLNEFSKEIHSFSDCQLYVIIAYTSVIEKNIAGLKQELAKRLK